MPRTVPLHTKERVAIQIGRKHILENCADLIEEARTGFDQERFPRSCFLAMTAIEEAGKLGVLRFMAHAEAERLGVAPTEVDAKRLGNFFRNHPEKAREAAASSLYINAGADRRHGTHPTSAINRTSGLILLVRSGQWMSIRNACLYVDMQLTPPVITYPRAAVSKALAYYMICMASEVAAEQAASAIENVQGWLEFEEVQIAKLGEFMQTWAVSTNIDELPFLAAPDQYRAAAKLREKVKT